jgi:hypothetical protein
MEALKRDAGYTVWLGELKELKTCSVEMGRQKNNKVTMITKERRKYINHQLGKSIN